MKSSPFPTRRVGHFPLCLLLFFLIACNGSSNDPTPFATLTISIEGQGTVDRSPPGDRYAEGATVRLTARPAEGWQFVEWREDLAGTDPEATLVIQGDPFVTALFAPIPEETVPLSLTVLGDGGEVSVQPPGRFYLPGTDVTLEASAREGFELWYWVGDASGTQSRQTVTMNERKDITAVFHEKFKFPLEPERFSFNLYTTGEGDILSEPFDRFLLYGHPVTLEALPADGGHFSAWSGDISGSENPVTFILDENKFIRATFRDSAEPPEQFRLMILDSPMGEIHVDPPGEIFPAGTTVRLVAVPGPGARFLNWTGDAEGFDPDITLTMDRERTVGARFFQQFSSETNRLSLPRMGLWAQRFPPFGSAVIGVVGGPGVRSSRRFGRCRYHFHHRPALSIHPKQSRFRRLFLPRPAAGEVGGNQYQKPVSRREHLDRRVGAGIEGNRRGQVLAVHHRAFGGKGDQRIDALAPMLRE